MSTFALAIGPWSMLHIIDKSVCESFSTSTLGKRSSCADVEVTKSNTDVKCDNLHEPYPCHLERGDSGPYLPCRLFGPLDLISQIEACDSWKLYIPACLQASYELLGSHPFSKVDMLFLPRCFSGLGLASPSLVFLSQSLFVNNGIVSVTDKTYCTIYHGILFYWNSFT